MTYPFHRACWSPAREACWGDGSFTNSFVAASECARWFGVHEALIFSVPTRWNAVVSMGGVPVAGQARAMRLKSLFRASARR